MTNQSTQVIGIECRDMLLAISSVNVACEQVHVSRYPRPQNATVRLAPHLRCRICTHQSSARRERLTAQGVNQVSWCVEACQEHIVNSRQTIISQSMRLSHRICIHGRVFPSSLWIILALFGRVLLCYSENDSARPSPLGDPLSR